MKKIFYSPSELSSKELLMVFLSIIFVCVPFALFYTYFVHPHYWKNRLILLKILQTKSNLTFHTLNKSTFDGIWDDYTLYDYKFEYITNGGVVIPLEITRWASETTNKSDITTAGGSDLIGLFTSGPIDRYIVNQIVKELKTYEK